MLEQYTPLHLAAHCCPHNVYEEVAAVEDSQEHAKEDGDRGGGSGTVESDGASTVPFGRQLSCEETIKFITKKDGVKVSSSLHQAVHGINIAACVLLCEHAC